MKKNRYSSTLPAIVQELRQHSSFLLTTHLSPDGDGLGGIISLGLALKSLGKDVVWFVEDSIPKNYAFLPCINEIQFTIGEIKDFERRMVVVVDSSDLERTGQWVSSLGQKQKVYNFDHHISNTGYGDEYFIDPDAASVCELIFNVINQLSVEINHDIATCLLTGLITDTGCFRFSNTTINTLELSAQLIKLGGKYREIINNVFERKSYEEIVLLARALNRLNIEGNGKLAWLSIPLHLTVDLGITNEQTEVIVNLARNIEGVELSILFKEVEPGTIKISFRSNKEVDVSQLALRFGGGGHPRAAGCTIKTTVMDNIIEKVLGLARQVLNEPELL